MDLKKGTAVGKYRLESPLAQGGMGSVWMARHERLGTPVAIKFLAAALAASTRSLARFEREAHAATVIQSPHVVQIHDFGVEGDTPYLVMELLEGENLGARLQRAGRLSLSETARILLQIGKALRRAHTAGIVHRDLKPGNIFLANDDGEELVKILDFGIAKSADTPVREQTEPGTMLGSPNYMSPEQAAGDRTVDRRSDLWSLAVVLYQTITGQLPFQGHTMGNVLKKVFLESPRRATELVPDLPPGIDHFFEKALAKKRDDRFQSIDDLVIAFISIAAPDQAVPPPSWGRSPSVVPRPCEQDEEPSCTSLPGAGEEEVDQPSHPSVREAPTVQLRPSSLGRVATPDHIAFPERLSIPERPSDRESVPVSVTLGDPVRPKKRFEALPWILLLAMLAIPPFYYAVIHTAEWLRPVADTVAARFLDGSGVEAAPSDTSTPPCTEHGEGAYPVAAPARPAASATPTVAPETAEPAATAKPVAAAKADVPSKPVTAAPAKTAGAGSRPTGKAKKPPLRPDMYDDSESGVPARRPGHSPPSDKRWF